MLSETTEGIQDAWVGLAGLIGGGTKKKNNNKKNPNTKKQTHAKQKKQPTGYPYQWEYPGA